MRVASSQVRWLFAVTLACATVYSANVGRAQDAVSTANRNAYDLAMKCFVAYGTARGNEQDAGNASEASGYESHARQSFDIAVALGDKLGFTGGRQNEDFGMAQSRELPKFVQDRAYLKSTLTTCKSAGL